jgi:hypothetical protein
VHGSGRGEEVKRRDIALLCLCCSNLQLPQDYSDSWVGAVFFFHDNFLFLDFFFFSDKRYYGVFFFPIKISFIFNLQ